MQTWPAGMTLTNWDLGGAVSDWSYAHAAEWQPTKQLLPRQAAGDLVLQPRPVPAAVQAQVDTGRVQGFTVLVDGAVAHRWQANLPAPRLLMSVSKVFMSLLVGLLVSEGALHYADEVRTHLPELGPEWEGCQVHHLLDMTSGVLCPEAGDPGSYQDPNHPFFQFEASLGWRPARTHATPYELVAGMGRAGTPGRHYAYTSANTFLLLWVCERITGRGYAELLQERIWRHLALRSRAAICTNSDGTPNPHGGIIMSTDDLARFGTVFTPSVRAMGHHLTVPDSYEAMLRRDLGQTLPWNPPNTQPAGHWNWIAPTGDRFKSGFGGQGLFVSPARCIVIAFTGVPDAHGVANSLGLLVEDWADELSR